jgi:hypothetical protein
LSRLDTQPTLWGTTQAERWGALDEAADQLQQQLGKAVISRNIASSVEFMTE